MLAAEGYPPLYLSGALLRAKSQYYAALANVQLQGESGPWLELLGNAVVESCDESGNRSFAATGHIRPRAAYLAS